MGLRVASRGMSPVGMWRAARRWLRSLALVALPLPGGPIRTSRIAHSKPRGESANPAGDPRDSLRSSRGLETLVVRQPRVIPHDKVAVDLLHQVQRHADDDQ